MKIILNANIYTLDRERPIASALACYKGRIIAVGASESILSAYAKRDTGTEIFDLKNRTVIPGLVDSHIHLKSFGLGLDKVDCETKSKEECLQRIADRVRETPEGKWILGHGWNQNDWVEGFGTAGELDKIAPQNPVYLTAKSLHAAWVNNLALKLANISSNTLDPEGGFVQKDDWGTPTGILFENAMQLVKRAIPDPSMPEVVEAIDKAQPILWQMGITGVHDFDRRACFVALQSLHEQKRLRLRVLKSIPLDDLEYAVKLGLRSYFGDDYLRIGPVKLFSDGALGPQTAAMLEPYQGEPNNRGLLLMDSEEIVERGRLAIENGLSLAVHAIGDRANHEVLNAFSQLREFEKDILTSTMRSVKAGHGEETEKRQDAGLLRHRIEHVQLIHPNDASRLAELNIIASMQPIHATSDMEMADRYWGARSELAYAWRTQLSNGALLVFGSDAPVDWPNPFWGLHAAVTRRRHDSSPGESGWYGEQRISLFDAMRAYTTTAAYAAGMEDRLGRLSPGYYADLVVLDEDIFNCEPAWLWKIKPVGTMIEGNWVFLQDGVF